MAPLETTGKISPLFHIKPSKNKERLTTLPLFRYHHLLCCCYISQSEITQCKQILAASKHSVIVCLMHKGAVLERNEVMTPLSDLDFFCRLGGYSCSVKRQVFSSTHVLCDNTIFFRKAGYRDCRIDDLCILHNNDISNLFKIPIQIF